MESGCLQDIVTKLIIFKSARYEIIWNKIFYYFQLFSIYDPQKHEIWLGAKTSFISIRTFELIVAPCDLWPVITYANVIGNEAL
jgi:hypothetical protein